MSRFNKRYFPSLEYQRTRVLSDREPSNPIGITWIVCPGCNDDVQYLEEEGVCVRCANKSTFENNWRTQIEEEKLVTYHEPDNLTYKYKS